MFLGRLVRGALALLLVLGAALVAALIYSVPVKGEGMGPTLRPGDRLEVSVFAPHDIARFDLVALPVPSNSTDPRLKGMRTIVSRVIALPGDRVAIAGGAKPVVYVRPAGTAATYQVKNPTWAHHGTAAIDTAGCCTDALESLRGHGRRWALVPAGRYFVLGDRWDKAVDSRVLGTIAQHDLRRLVLKIQPVTDLGRVPNRARLVPVLG